jgi:TrmH family RNA methyltransferase
VKNQQPLRPLKWYRGLGERRNRQEAGAFLVEGERAIRQVMSASPREIIEVVSVEAPPPEMLRYPLRTVTESQFDFISNTRTPQGILAVVRLPADTYTDSLPHGPGERLLLLEDVQDPGNTGTLIRTAAALGFSGAVLTENSADPFSPKCVQATAGAVLSVWLRRTPRYLKMVTELKDRGYTLVAADLAGGDGPSALNGLGRTVLALGNEAAGLSRKLLELADYRVRLPVARQKAESLNVATSGAILMYLASGKP